MYSIKYVSLMCAFFACFTPETELRPSILGPRTE